VTAALLTKLSHLPRIFLVSQLLIVLMAFNWRSCSLVSVAIKYGYARRDLLRPILCRPITLPQL
jgi:hypothetical protein